MALNPNRMSGAALLGLGLLILGCGGGNPSTATLPPAPEPPDPATAGSLAVHLVADGLPGALRHLDVALGKLELHSNGSWQTVPLAAAVIATSAQDLLAASSAAPLILANPVPWPPGVSDAMRFTFAPGGTVQFVTDSPDTVHPLAVPAQVVGAMGLPGTVTVLAQAATDLWITFGVAGVVGPDPANPANYVLLPGPIRGYALAATGTVAGGVSLQPAAPSASAASPLPGAAVTAQLQAAEGTPGAGIAFRTAVTDADGRYTLDLLPKGYTWCAVTMPVLGTAAYCGAASAGFALGDAPADTFQADLAVPAVAATGSVTGTVAAAPGPGQLAVVDLVASLNAGGVSTRFTVASAVVNAQGRFSFPVLAPGFYAAVLNTYSDAPSLGLVDQPETSAAFLVTAGAATTLAF